MRLTRFTTLFLAITILSILGFGQTVRQSKAKRAPTLTPQMRHFKQIEQFIAKGKTAEAVTEAGVMLLQFPVDIEVHHKAYDVYAALGQKAEALALLDAMLEKFATNADVAYKGYQAYFTQGDLAKAERYLNLSISLASDETVKAARRQQLLQIIAKKEEAARLRAEAEEKAARIGIIEKRIADGDPSGAAVDLERLTDAFPKDGDLRFRAYEILAGLEKFTEAERRLNESIEMAGDPELKNQRKLKIVDLNYRREIVLERKRKEQIGLAFKRISLLINDRKTQEAIDALHEIIKSHPRNADVHYRAYETFVLVGDFVAAEFHLNKASDLCTDAKVKSERQLQFIELNYNREKAAKELLDLVSTHIDQVNYPEAVNALEAMDKISLYHQKGYIMRGGLLGVYRRYEEAVKIYNRVLEDMTLDQQTRRETEELRDYCVSKIVNHPRPAEGARHCHFCGAAQYKNAAYCHMCLMFQHPIATVTWKNSVTSFNWQGQRLSAVRYNFKKTHKARNFFAGLAAVGAAVGNQGTAVEYSQQDPEYITRNFTFKFNETGPAGVDFNSSADGGTIQTYQAVAYSSGSDVQVIGESGGVSGAFTFEDKFIYPNMPYLDPTFALLAFKRNIHRGFAPNNTFDPTLWNEPHLYVFYYDRDSRITKAVQCYEYKGKSVAGHAVIGGRRQFTGANSQDPLSQADLTLVEYNNEGLVKAIKLLFNERETYRREMIYGPQGIIAENEIVNGKVIAKWEYKWKGERLLETSINNKAGYDFKVLFR